MNTNQYRSIYWLLVGIFTLLLGQSCGDTLERVSDLIGGTASHECATPVMTGEPMSGRKEDA